MENWLGQIQIKVDEKGRLALPSSALDFFPEKDIVLSLSVYDKKPYLELLSLEDWKTKLERLKTMPTKSPKAKAYKRFLLSGSSKVSLDKQNRITIPFFQRAGLHLSKEAVVIYLDGRVELWSAEVWKRVSETFVQDFEGLEEWADEDNLEDSNMEGDKGGLTSVA